MTDWTSSATFMERFPIEYCRAHQLLVIEEDGQQLGLVTDATPALVIDCVGRVLGRPLTTRQVEERTLREWTNRLYESQATESAASTTGWQKHINESIFIDRPKSGVN
jgi:general secretion pathway protein E